MKNIFILTILFISISLYGQSSNRLYTRLFYQKPDFHNSKTQINQVLGIDYSMNILTPIDNRKDFIGELVTKRIEVQEYKDFWSSPLASIITDKLSSDLKSLGVVDNANEIINIQPIIEVMYTCPRGFIWLKCYSKVRMRFIVNKSGIEIINNTFESTYFTAGTDSEYEGKMTDTIENFANITLGICLRKSLDKFYSELKTRL